jgi:type I restriction enzyme, S subunit
LLGCFLHSQPSIPGLPDLNHNPAIPFGLLFRKFCLSSYRKSYLFIHTPLENLVVSTGFIVLSPKAIPPSYLYAWVTTDEFVDYLVLNADGSAYPAVRPDRFSDAQILLPVKAILDKFDQQVSSMRDKIIQNERESTVLKSIRDALLPKLLSGEIRVKDAEKVVEQELSGVKG